MFSGGKSSLLVRVIGIKKVRTMAGHQNPKLKIFLIPLSIGLFPLFLQPINIL